MGLGNASVRKSYYPELQKKIEELNSEKNYISDIINSMPSVLIGVNGDGEITRWNKRAERIYGFGESEVLGRRIKDVLPYLSDEADQIIKEGFYFFESKTIRKTRMNGESLIYEDLALFPLTDPKAKGAVLRIDDVTEQVRLQETMVQSEKMLSVGGLAAGMAHEINNPLAGIMQTAGVMTKRLMETDLPANRKAAERSGLELDKLKAYMDDRGIGKMLEAIKESGFRASTIIRNMLSFSRRDNDSYSTHEPVKMLDQIIELAATDFNLKKHYDFKNIELIRQYEENLPLLPCSETQIQQVILNLLRNGAEALSEIIDPSFAPRIILRLKQENRMIRIEVEDNGPGISHEEQRRIFEPFYTTKPVGIGTGLGLSVSYFIITENHKGSLEVHSEPEKGARFIIRLPLER